MSSRMQNLIVLLGLLVVVALGYYIYTQNDAINLSTSGQQLSSQATAESAEFLAKLNELKQISLDGSIFRDPRFRSLRDNQPPIVQENVGRENPFSEVNN